MSNSTFGQGDFSAGIWRGRKAPQAAVYDAQNALVDDEGNLARRGATALYSTSDAANNLNWLQIAHADAPAANRVLAQGAPLMYVLDASNHPVEISDGTDALEGDVLGHPSRLTSVGDFIVWADGPLNLYAGSRKPYYDTGFFSVTEGSTTVTGSGTSWLANVDPGMILSSFLPLGFYVVASVQSDTSLTLRHPWAESTVSAGAYKLSPVFLTIGAKPNKYVTAAGSGIPRLMFVQENRVYFTEPGDVSTGGFATALQGERYHELPANAVIVGIEGIGDAAEVFTTRGVWRISNLSFDPVDDSGNVQHIVERINKDVVLWGDSGIAAYDVGLVVPAIDDVYLMDGDGGVRSISGGVRALYRSYVDAGYQPGFATVYRGHYLLAILNSGAWVDTLVCRLDRPTQTPSGQVIYPWTRWTGHAGGPAYAVLIEETAREPKLFGLAGKRVTDLTATLDGQGATDADGTNVSFTWTTNDIPLANGTATKVRGRFELVSASSPTVTVEYSSDQDAGAFTALTVKGEQGGAAGWGKSDGSKYQWANVAKKRDRIRFRFTLSGAATSLVWRAVELLYRASGKQ